MNEFHEIGNALFNRHIVEAEDYWDYHHITGCKCKPHCESDDHWNYFVSSIEDIVRDEVGHLHDAYQNDFPDYILPRRCYSYCNETYFSCSSRMLRLWAIYFGAQDRERAIKIIAPQVVDHLDMYVPNIPKKTNKQFFIRSQV